MYTQVAIWALKEVHERTHPGAMLGKPEAKTNGQAKATGGTLLSTLAMEAEDEPSDACCGRRTIRTRIDHHYVPQFYLRQWAGADGGVWRYRREPSGLITERAVAPKGTAFEPDLYAVVDAGEFRPPHDPHIIETDFLSPIDNAAAPILKKLNESSPSPLDDAERTAWALFMNSLNERSPTTLGWRDQAAPDAAAQTVAHLRSMGTTPESRERMELILARMDVEQMARNSVRQFMVNEIRDPKVITYLKGLTWVVIGREPERPFITTDRPLLVNVVGPGPTTIHVLSMALSPTKLLCPSVAVGDDGRAAPGAPMWMRLIVVVYASSPVKSLVGAFTVGGVISEPVARMWKQHTSALGVSRKDYDDYFDGTGLAHRLLVAASVATRRCRWTCSGDVPRSARPRATCSGSAAWPSSCHLRRARGWRAFGACRQPRSSGHEEGGSRGLDGPRRWYRCGAPAQRARSRCPASLALALLPYLRELLALKQWGVELVNVAAMREALARPSRMRGRRAGREVKREAVVEL